MNAEAHMRKAELDISKKRIVQLHRILETIKSLRQKLADAYNQRDEARKVAECPFPFKRRTECESDVRQLQQTRSLRSATPKGEGT